jgi:chloramphenicol-sensitive protein RarD
LLGAVSTVLETPETSPSCRNSQPSTALVCSVGAGDPGGAAALEGTLEAGRPTQTGLCNSGRVVETSLGYFMNPIVNVLLGVVVLRERLHWGQWLAVLLAAAGVSYSVWGAGQMPWIALSLAISFGIYGLLRKLIVVPPLLGLALETSWLTPVALGYLLLQPDQQFGRQPIPTLLLLGAGVVTSLPLFCFSSAAQRLPLSTMGFFQYIAPSLQLLLGVWVYGEPFTRSSLVVFSCIWSALLLFTLVAIFKMPKTSPAEKPFTDKP